MNNLITIVLTYRDRERSIVTKCLESLKNQTNKEFEVVLVDYGSKAAIDELVLAYTFVKLIKCKTEQQLWCKSRAINIVLKNCKTPYFFVGDMDMIYHPNFIETLQQLKQKQEAIYFQVGFLNGTESKKDVSFHDYSINFKSYEDATGMTFFKTEALKSIHGYDEFYNGWGGEDTDVHVRLKNAGYKVNFYTEKVLMLHQWHPKHYRIASDIMPFHPKLEQINHQYLEFTRQTNKTKANLNFDWGIYNESDYVTLENADFNFSLTNKEAEVKSFISNVLLAEKDKVIKVSITLDADYKSIKQTTKKLLQKKTISFLEMFAINKLLLECIINNLRDCAYQYQYNSNKQTIHLIIKL
ncbi:GT2 family glycosyltransferase [Mariniflexile fucanivorans]|uniref:GT2 family glycosyltransferase n=1 Tax=Mariniflexile fucanivorans TaxID=264023 RepID=A0A4R1RDE3_9FLAO|nr:glycosyltransferase [Mariniflexile fucanivorans]TCL63885.1 GT2 family glycosyltransferase [Mariniflexile fucanivorans]